MLISDGGGDLAILDVSANPQYQGNMLLASGPTSADMDDVVELNGVVYVAADGIMNRFDTQESRWLAPKLIGDISISGLPMTYLYLAGDNIKGHKMNDNGHRTSWNVKMV